MVPYRCKSGSRTGSETYTGPEPEKQSWKSFFISIGLPGRKRSSFLVVQTNPRRAAFRRHHPLQSHFRPHTLAVGLAWWLFGMALAVGYVGFVYTDRKSVV